MLITTLGGLWVELTPGDIVALSCTKSLDEPVMFIRYDNGHIWYKPTFGPPASALAEGMFIKLLEKGRPDDIEAWI